MKRETKRIIDEHELSYMAVRHEGGTMFIVGAQTVTSVGGDWSKLFVRNCGIGTDLDDAVKSWQSRQVRLTRGRK